MSQGIGHLSAVGDDGSDSVKRQQTFAAAHPEVTFGFHGVYVSAQWPEGGEGPPRRLTRILMMDLLDALDTEFENVIIQPAPAGTSQDSPAGKSE